MFKNLLITSTGLLLLFLPTIVSAEEDDGPRLPAPTLRYKIVCGNSPQGIFSWNAISGATGYFFYTSRGQNTNQQTVSGTKVTVNLSLSDDYKYQVEAKHPDFNEGKVSEAIIVKGSEVTRQCGVVGSSSDREEGESVSEDKKEVEAEDQLKTQDIKKEEDEKESTTSSDNERNTDLEKKVGELSKELEQAKQRQNALEQIVNNLLNFIKSIFRL